MNKSKDVILITGITGQQGGAVATELLSRGYKLRGLTRKPQSPVAVQFSRRGVQIVQGDLDDPASLEHAVDGVWGVFAVQNTWEAGVEREEEQGKRIAELARRKGVQHYVYTSVGSAHRATGIPHFDNKWRIEETVRALKFPSHVILRPVFFMENWLSEGLKPELDAGRLTMALQPTTALQQISVRDIGRFGALAFEKHDKLNRREIDIAGDSKTMPETAEVFSRAWNRKIEFVQAPIEAVRQASADYAAMLEWFDRIGYNADIAGLKKEFGVPLLTLEQWANQAAQRTAG